MRLVKHPVLCNYYVTYRCNASCDFCDIWEKPSPYVTFDDVQKNLLDLKKLGVKVIDFTGGEPLLHREIVDFLDEAKKLGFITTLTTNTLLYPKLSEKLVEKIDMLHFSLDYASAEKHDAVRGVGCFQFVLDSIKQAKSLGERPDILMTVFDENFDEIEKIYRQIVMPNNLVLLLNPVFDYNNVENHGGLSHENLLKLKKWAKKPNVYLNEAFIDLRLDGGNKINNPICKAASTTVVISPENELLIPCYHLGEKALKINKNLLKLFSSNEALTARNQEGRLESCEGCVINCYMQPSFAVNINKYWFKALPSTLKYARLKGTWKQLF